MADKPESKESKETSLSKADLARWRFNDCNGFVVYDYTGCVKGQGQGNPPAIMVVKAPEIFELLADVFENQKKVTIFSIGPCVLDLS